MEYIPVHDLVMILAGAASTLKDKNVRVLVHGFEDLDAMGAPKKNLKKSMRHKR